MDTNITGEFNIDLYWSIIFSRERHILLWRKYAAIFLPIITTTARNTSIVNRLYKCLANDPSIANKLSNCRACPISVIEYYVWWLSQCYARNNVRRMTFGVTIDDADLTISNTFCVVDIELPFGLSTTIIQMGKLLNFYSLLCVHKYFSIFIFIQLLNNWL